MMRGESGPGNADPAQARPQPSNRSSTLSSGGSVDMVNDHTTGCLRYWEPAG